MSDQHTPHNPAATPQKTGTARHGSAAGSGDNATGHGAHAGSPYWRLALMLLISFAAMFTLMYAMVNTFENVVPNINQFYMAGLMTAPMLLIELWLMRSMYPNSQLNIALTAVGLIALLGFWLGIREQVAIDDQQLLKSMIPHHAGAILMCEEAEVQLPKVQQLCNGIISAQKSEIAQMRAIIGELQAQR